MAYPIYPGTDIKLQVASRIDDFLLTENNFQIVIKNRWGRIVSKITKNDCFYDSDGRFYFTLENVARGEYYAYFEGWIDDDDYDKQKAKVTDYQRLIRVPSLPRCLTPAESRLHKVEYQVVQEVEIDGEVYLADCYGRYIYTSDGKRIQFTNDVSEKIEDMGKVKMNMTGEQFKQLIEGENPDGAIDTIPEMLRAATGISDDTTIRKDVDDQIDEGLEQNKGTEADIDEIFNN